MSLRTALVTVVGITLWLVLAAVPSGAQGTSAETNQPPAAQAQFQAAVPDPGTGIPDSIPLNTVAPAAPDNYLIGHNDLLYVYVYQMPEFTRQVRVDDQGDIRLPFLARTLPAAGGTGRQLAERVEKALVASELARNPMVSVVVRQVMSQPIVVGGAVREPLNLQSPRSMTLLELIARAGGLSDSPPAGMEAIVMNNPPDRKQVTRVNLSQLLRGEGDYVSMPIQGGATVMVMTAPKVYAIGALNKPGAFPLGVGESISALRLVALAEGVKAPAMDPMRRSYGCRRMAAG